MSAIRIITYNVMVSVLTVETPCCNDTQLCLVEKAFSFAVHGVQIEKALTNPSPAMKEASKMPTQLPNYALKKYSVLHEVP